MLLVDSRLLSLALLAGCLSAGCAREPSAVPRATPIVLISIDTLRSDHVPAYGYHGVETPAFDRLAAAGVLFERAYSHTPLTLPSHASILTGLLPERHRVRDNTGYRLDSERFPTLASRLRGKGYATAGFVSVFLLTASSGIGAGFDTYDAPRGDTRSPDPESLERSGAATVTAAISWLTSHRGQPYFLFLHLYEPHFPYRPPAGLTARHATPYDGEIAVADAAVGRLLDALEALGDYERALIVLLSDHGEGLGDHGEAQHGLLLYREALQVPLIVKPAEARRGVARVSQPVQLIDVAPTILVAAGLAKPKELSGDDLLAFAERPHRGRNIFSETFYPRLHFGWSELASVVADGAHYIHGPRPELFDLDADSAESTDTLAADRRTFGALRAEVARHERSLEAPQHTDGDTASKVLSLGYLAGGSASDTQRSDPRDHRQEIALLGAAVEELTAERREKAAEHLERLVALDPGILDAWSLLGQTYHKLGRVEAALRAYRRAYDVSGGSNDFVAPIALLLLELRRPDEARRFADLAPEGPETKALIARVALAQGRLADAFAAARVLGIGPIDEAVRREVATALADQGARSDALILLEPMAGAGSVPTLNALGSILTEEGRAAAAVPLLRRAVALDPANTRSAVFLAAALLGTGEDGEARALLESAVLSTSVESEDLNTLGVARYRTGDAVAAMQAWQQAADLDRRQASALLNLGLVAAEHGDEPRARRALTDFLARAPRARFAKERARAGELLRRLGT